jgi:hypothetical protein
MEAMPLTVFGGIGLTIHLGAGTMDMAMAIFGAMATIITAGTGLYGWILVGAGTVRFGTQGIMATLITIITILITMEMFIMAITMGITEIITTDVP